MDQRQKQINNLLWKEVAAKSTPAAITFIVIAILVSWYHFNLTIYASIIEGACLVVIFSNILRYYVSKQIGTHDIATESQRNQLRISIWLNSVGWGLIFSLSTYELNMAGYQFAILITVMMGFLASSLITLAYDKTLFIPFQLLILVPMILVTLYQYEVRGTQDAKWVAMAMAFFIVYQLKQYRDYRALLIQRFTTQLELADSYDELKDQTAKLIHASKISALGDMAGGLAHEVNNSLMVILGSSQQVERDLKKKEVMTPELQSKMDLTSQAIFKIKNVIEGLKYFSLQMETAPKEVVPLKDVIDRTLNYCHELLMAHNVDFQVHDVPDVKILCNPFQITQILFALTKNADDALVTCKTTKWIHYEFEILKGFILIKVKNCGNTVSPENQTKLFQPFFSTKDVNQGSGLSLSISKGMAMDHKGDLYFEMDEYSTSFVLKLPITQ
ncbi:sensor histidine kinase [Peredibacter starrii]|uniref:histidine kinase n=1 Tax=Peredibacter starrii TaxID=28202 RepID=A0AAX4HJG9_9BACT|nr:HAMP domain-containing sensor histidine kinase [Peredibacter starrii]WPU63374.1 HAMP domain-containing sensor histidine kinase [Peredibacter starrii]